MCWELARIVMDRLDNVATVVDETHGFKFFDNRDLLGFVDGTENPENSDAKERGSHLHPVYLAIHPMVHT